MRRKRSDKINNTFWHSSKLSIRMIIYHCHCKSCQSNELCNDNDTIYVVGQVDYRMWIFQHWKHCRFSLGNENRQTDMICSSYLTRWITVNERWSTYEIITTNQRERERERERNRSLRIEHEHVRFYVEWIRTRTYESLDWLHLVSWWVTVALSYVRISFSFDYCCRLHTTMINIRPHLSHSVQLHPMWWIWMMFLITLSFCLLLTRSH
jgi:hypothetical protein